MLTIILIMLTSSSPRTAVIIYLNVLFTPASFLNVVCYHWSTSRPRKLLDAGAAVRCLRSHIPTQHGHQRWVCPDAAQRIYARWQDGTLGEHSLYGVRGTSLSCVQKASSVADCISVVIQTGVMRNVQNSSASSCLSGEVLKGA